MQTQNVKDEGKEGKGREGTESTHSLPRSAVISVAFVCLFVVVVVYLVHRMAAGPRSCTVPGKSGQQLQEGESRVFIISGCASANGKRKGKEDG